MTSVQLPRILVIDDDPAITQLMGEILTSYGYRFRAASDGLSALDIVAAEPPDLILLDVRMPDMDGYEVCRRIKADEKSRSIPVIFISGFNETTDKVMGFRAGGVDFVTKPFSVAEVLARISTHLTLRSLQERVELRNAQLQEEVAKRMITEGELRKHKVHLEELVAERTARIQRINDELRQEAEERRRAEEALRESETQYRTVFENSGSGMAIIEEDMTLSLVNEEFCHLTGYAKKDVEGHMHWADFVIPEDVPRLMKQHRARLRRKGGAAQTFECTVQRQDGETRNFLATAELFPNSRRSVVSITDITELKRAEEALQKSRDELEQRVAERTADLTAANDHLRQLFRKQDMDINLAKKVMSLINAVPPRHTTLSDEAELFVHTIYRPCNAEGGDHFFVRNFTRETHGAAKSVISLKDQSGHEVSCILRSIMTDLIHNAILHEDVSCPVEEVMSRLNREICKLSLFSDDDFFTGIVFDIDHETLMMRYVSAGHPPAALIRDRAVLPLPGPDGAGRNLPMGILPDAVYTAGEIQLKRGDRIICCTDGLMDSPEYRNSGKSGTLPVLVGPLLAEAEEGISAHVSALMGKLLFPLQNGETGKAAATLEDDITLLGLEIEDRRPWREDVLSPRTLDDFSAQVGALYDTIRQEWVDAGFNPAGVRLRTVLEEILTNAWRHGNRKSPNKSIVVRRRYGNDAVVEVIDEGDGFDHRHFCDPTRPENRLRPDGRGNYMICRFSDDVAWESGGRHISTFFSQETRSLTEKMPKTTLDYWASMKKTFSEGKQIA